MRKRLLFYGLIVLIPGALASYWLTHQPLPTLPKVSPPVHMEPVKTPDAVGQFSKTKFSITDPTSNWLIVNKQRPLQPQSHTPGDLVTPKVATRVADIQLRQETARALEALFAAAEQAGNPLRLSSGYRSYNYQVNLYNGYVKSQGQVEADAQSARPGFSEHQTGMAADVGPLNGACNVQTCFATTPAGRWLATHAHEHGFIIRYPEGLTAVTGYMYEPWHVRYVGTELANEMTRSGAKTMEQFFGLPPAPDYTAN